MQSTEAQTTYKSRVKVLQRFFLKSRNQWKAKCGAAKSALKLARNQIRAVEKSREVWKAQAQHMKAQLHEMQRQLEELQSKSGRAPGQ